MENFIGLLLIAGLLAGAVNFFVSYLELPLPGPKYAGDEWPKVKTLAIAIIGYAIVGVAGAMLTPLINAVVGGLKGLEILNGVPSNPFFKYIFFGYGLIFGYSTTRLLLSILDSIIKRLSKIESTIASYHVTQVASLYTNNSSARSIIDECESQFKTYKSDCSGLVKSVSEAFDISLNGQADDIVDQIKGIDWTRLQNGIEAKEKADSGWFVIAGLKGSENVPPQNNGHVAIVVSGPIAQGKYPSAYWGKLGSVGEKNKTLNWAWNAASRDKVYYAAKQLN